MGSPGALSRISHTRFAKRSLILLWPAPSKDQLARRPCLNPRPGLHVQQPDEAIADCRRARVARNYHGGRLVLILERSTNSAASRRAGHENPEGESRHQSPAFV